MTDPDFRAARPKPAPGPDPTRPPHGPDPEEPTARRGNGPAANQPNQDPLTVMRQVTYLLRPLNREQRRIVLETLLEISE